MKILHTMAHNRDFDDKLVFWEYAPMEVEETDMFYEAECMFLYAYGNDLQLLVSRDQLIANGYPAIENDVLSLNNFTLEIADTVQKVFETLHDLPRIIYLETFGKTSYRAGYNEDGSLPRAIRDKDIPVSTSPEILDRHPNALFARTVDNREYYTTRQTHKRKGTLTVMRDTLKETLQVETIKALLASDACSRINIFHGDAEALREILGESATHPKIVGLPHKDPHGVRSVLSDSEWTLHIDPNAGMERMGIEGGFCGAQPIYLDTPYYRKLYRDDLGVRYVDPGDITHQVVATIEKGSDWDKHQDAFTRHFGSEYHMPQFWKDVMKIVMG